MVDIGGQPVIQEIATAIPNEREKAAGVRPPPPPPPAHASPIQQVGLNTAPQSPTPGPGPSFNHEPAPKEPGPPRAVTPPFERRPYTPKRQSVNPPLAVTTSLKPATGRAKEPPTPLADVSSPVSSIDVDRDSHANSVNGIISSATSPDPTHIEVAADIPKVLRATTIPATETVQDVSRPSTPATDDTESDLPSKAAIHDIRKDEQEIEIPIAKPRAESTKPSTPALEHVPIPVQVAPQPPLEDEQEGTLDVTSSPDPSAQLQLENELANGKTPIPESEIPEQPLEVREEPSPADAPTAAHVSPPPPPQVAQQAQSEDEDDDASLSDDEEEEEEEEDTVQLVGSNGPPSRMSSPTVLEEAPVEQPKASEVLSAAEDREVVPTPTAEAIPQHVAPPQQEPVVEALPPPPPAPEPPAQAPVELEVVEKPPPVEPPQKARTPTPVRDAVPSPTVVVDIPQAPPISLAPVEVNEREDVEIPDAPLPQPVIETVTTPPPTRTQRAPSTPLFETAPEVAAKPTPQPQPSVERVDDPSVVTDEDLSSVEVDKAEVQDAFSPVQQPQVVPIPTPVDQSTISGSTEATEPPVPPPTLAAPTTTPKKPTKPKPRSEPKLVKVVISSAHHAKKLEEEKSRGNREDEEQQGIIVQRRRNQQAATTAARGRPTVFPPGSKMEYLTRYSIKDPQVEEATKPQPQIFDALYTIQSMPKNIGELIDKSSKSVTSNYHDVRYFDGQTSRILGRIQELQSQGLWSLCQPRAVPEPPRRKAHWDYLLEEMKWLREDFREERKWKIAVAKQVAGWVLEWHHATPEQRVEWDLVVDRSKIGTIPKGIRDSKKRPQSLNVDIEMGDPSQPTPDLISSADTPRSPEDEGGDDYFVKLEGAEDTVMNLDEHGEYFKHLEGPPPAALFGLSLNDTMFTIAPTKAAQDILDQLPLYAAPKPPPSDDVPVLYQDPNKRPFIPVSKWAVATMKFADEEEGPRRKRSRYDYDVNNELYADDDSDDDGEVAGLSLGYEAPGRSRGRDKTTRSMPLHPEQNNVALFRPEFKSTLQRIRSHVFRPPTDMPPAAFFECRTPSLWTPEEDERLRSLSKEYNHNWSLVSQLMVIDGNFHSGGERRSPWECFERWLGLESIPQEFTKTPYYKHVQSRLDIAAKMSNSYVTAASNGQQVSQLKRKGTIPMRVERRRNTRQYTLFEAMRKLAKKRETSISKQQQSGRAAQMAMRKQQDAPASNSQMRTPQYFATMKHEKELKAVEQKQQMLQMGRMPQQVTSPSCFFPRRLLTFSQATHPSAARLPNGVPVPQAAPRPAHLPNGAPIPARPPVPAPPTHLQVPAQNRPGPGRQMTQAEYIRMQAMRQQQLATQQQIAAASLTPQQQQALALHQAQLKQPRQNVPSHADMVAHIQQRNPAWSLEEANAAASRQIQQYHAQLANSISQRNPARVQSQQGGQGGTGVLIGANGPIGPGAQGAQAGQGSPAGTPPVMTGSPRLG